MTNADITRAKFDQYIEGVDPGMLWRSVFGCAPSDTDIAKGGSSAAAAALQTALERIGEEANSVELGCPVDLGAFKPAPETLSKIEGKLFSAAILETTAMKANSFLCDHKGTEFEAGFSTGTVAMIGSLDDARPVLEGMSMGGIAELLRHGDMSDQQPPICVLSGKPGVKVKVRDRRKLLEIFDTLVTDTVLALVSGDRDPAAVDVFYSQQHSQLPMALRFGDDDERARLDAILKFVGDRVDAEGIPVREAIRKAPFKRTLVQLLVGKAEAFIANELGRYGLVRVGDVYKAHYSDPKGLGPLMYRLLGDDEYSMEGLLRRDLLISVELSIPVYKAEGPSIVLLPPSDEAVAAFWREYNGADVVVALWGNAKHLPADSEVDDILSVTPSQSESIETAARIIARTFNIDFMTQEALQ